MTILLIYLFYLIIGILPSVDYYNKNHVLEVEDRFRSTIFRFLAGGLISLTIINTWVYYWLKGLCTFKPEAEEFFYVIVTSDIEIYPTSRTIKVFCCLNCDELAHFNLAEHKPYIFNNPQIKTSNINFNFVSKITYEYNMVEYLNTLKT